MEPRKPLETGLLDNKELRIKVLDLRNGFEPIHFNTHLLSTNSPVGVTGCPQDTYCLLRTGGRLSPAKCDLREEAFHQGLEGWV